MLTVEKLSANHRLIYEAIRDAGVAMSPKEVEEATGLPGSTVRGTVVTMSKKGLLNKLEYGLYEAVPLDQVHIDRTSPKGGEGKTPTAGSSISGIAHEDGPDYRVGTITLTIDREDDVQLLPAWAMPIIIGAASIIIQRVDVERARLAEERGRRYRLRVIVEDHDEDEGAKEPEQPPEEEGL